MDKIVVNNQVISMRKFVKQARLRLINKLVKDVKTLKFKKGTDVQLEKYKRKSEKLLAEIAILKKIHIDSVSKMALLKNKDWEAIIADKKSTLQDRTVALLAKCEAVQDSVNKFHELNARLVSHLPDFIEAWEAKKITEKKFPKGTKATDFRRNKRTSNSMGHQSSNKFRNCNNVPLGLRNQISSESTLLGETSSNGPSENSTDRREFTESKFRKDNLKIKKQSVVLPLANLETENLKQEITDENNSDDNPQSDGDDGGNTMEKDPFFITDDTQISDDDDKESSSNLVNSSCKNFKLDRQPKRNFDFENKSRFTNKRNDGSYGNKFLARSFGGNNPNNKFSGRRSFGGNDSNNKFSAGSSFGGMDSNNKFSTRKSFGGKDSNNKFLARKSFGVKDSNNKFDRSQKKEGYTNVSQRSGFKQQKNTGSNQSKGKVEEKLHPSWEAKKKLKSQGMKILPFQGTKIVFD